MVDLRAFTDADRGGDRDSRLSTSGQLTLVGRNLVTCTSKKKAVAMSSGEAGFEKSQKVLLKFYGSKNYYQNLVFHPRNVVIRTSDNLVQHEQAKHVEIDRHLIKYNLEKNVISLPFVREQDQLADILTKAVAPQVFEDTLSKLSLKILRPNLRGSVIVLGNNIILKSYKYSVYLIDINYFPGYSNQYQFTLILKSKLGNTSCINR